MGLLDDQKQGRGPKMEKRNSESVGSASVMTVGDSEGSPAPTGHPKLDRSPGLDLTGKARAVPRRVAADSRYRRQSPRDRRTHVQRV